MMNNILQYFLDESVKFKWRNLRDSLLLAKSGGNCQVDLEENQLHWAYVQSMLVVRTSLIGGTCKEAQNKNSEISGTIL
jgi:hypothetical protein